MRTTALICLCFVTGLSRFSYAETVSVEIHKVTDSGVGAVIGTISFADSEHGLQITPKLRDLAPGDHGFHIHDKPDCQPAEKDGKMVAAGAAGAHLDPGHTSMHAGPTGSGHAGDLPLLKVASSGQATTALNAPRLTVAALHQRAVMIHANGDNYADSPLPLGGGGARVACGVIR